MNSAVLADHKMKIKESQKYLDLARKLIKLWNMSASVIPIVICALGRSPGAWRDDWNIPAQRKKEINKQKKTKSKYKKNERKKGWLVRWLLVFYGISTHVGYLMSNPIYTHTHTHTHTHDILTKSRSVTLFLNDPELIYLDKDDFKYS